MRGVAAVLAGLLASACGGSPSSPSPAPLAPSPSSLSFTGRLVDVLDGKVVAAGTITADGLASVVSDGGGTFTLTPATAGSFQVTIAAPGYVERRTAVAVPGSAADVSLIPSSFSMETFNQWGRTAWHPQGRHRAVRWRAVPRLVIYTRELDCSHPTEIVILSRQVPDADVAEAIVQLRRALEAFSGGTFPDFADVTLEHGPVGERRDLLDARWDGVITAGTCVVIANGADGGGRTYRVRGLYEPSAGGAYWKTGLLPQRRQLAQIHEFGHALGLGHTYTTVPSIMSYNTFGGFSWDLTAFDRQAGRVLFSRPPGNINPDEDPPGYTVNAGMGMTAGLLQPPGTFDRGRAGEMCPGPPGR